MLNAILFPLGFLATLSLGALLGASLVESDHKRLAKEERLMEVVDTRD